MNKTITMYELFGLMLKRQAPKKIKVLGFIMNYVKNAHWGDYEDEKTHIRLSSFRLNECLNDEVEIIEEPTTCEEFAKMFQGNCKMFQPEEKKIPEKIKDKYNSQISKVELAQKYNEIIDYLHYLKSKGDE